MVDSLVPSAIFLKTKVLPVFTRVLALVLPELYSMLRSLSPSTTRLEELSPSSFEHRAHPLTPEISNSKSLTFSWFHRFRVFNDHTLKHNLNNFIFP